MWEQNTYNKNHFKLKAKVRNNKTKKKNETNDPNPTQVLGRLRV